jgi:hypothetical protein
VAARAALVKQLKAAGEKDEAARIAARKRPAFTVWALNVVARDDGPLVETAIDAGHALQGAMTGGDRDRRASAQQAEREATDALVEAAATRIEGQDHRATDAFRQRIRTTVRAAQLDDDVAARLRAGELEVDEEVSIFGSGGLTFAPPTQPAPKPTPTPKAKTAPAAKRKVAPTPAAPTGPAGPTAEELAAAREAEEARRIAVARFRTLAKEADRLERHAERLERDADDLRQRADAATAAATEARAAVTAARDAANAADPDA